MTDWFRSWHGAPTDHKWLVVARKAGTVPGIVSAIVWALFDHASQQVDRGDVRDFDVETYAAASGFEEDLIHKVIGALTDKGVIDDNRLTAWEKRQPKREDDSTARVALHRERNAPKRSVTQGNAPEKSREDTDTDKIPSLRSGISREFAEAFWPRYPNKVGKPAASKAFQSARKRAPLETIVAGLDHYIASKPPDRQWLNPTTFLNQDRWADEPSEAIERSNGHAKPARRSTADIAREFAEYASERRDDPVAPIGLLPGSRH